MIGLQFNQKLSRPKTLTWRGKERRTDERMDEQTNERTNVRTDGRTNERTEGWTNEQTNERTHRPENILPINGAYLNEPTYSQAVGYHRNILTLLNFT